MEELSHCVPFLDIRASKDFAEEYDSHMKIVITLTVGAGFALMGALFYLFDRHAQNLDQKIRGHAVRSNAVLLQVFPQEMRDRILFSR